MPHRQTCSFILLLVAMLLPRVQLAGAQEAMNIQTRLAQAGEYLEPQRYRQSAAQVGDRLAAPTHKNYTVHLVSGVGNAIVAACGSNCDHVEITLYDYQHKLVGRTPDKQNLVIMKGNPQYSGLHEIEISVPGCHASECDIGFAVFRQLQPSSASAPASVQQAPADGKTPSYRTHDNRDLDGGDFDMLRGVDLEQCLSTCKSDSRCRAYSFDKWNRACYLKSELAALRLDPRSMTGIRDDIPAPALAAGAKTMERYRGRAFSDIGYKSLKVGQLDACESICQREDQCVAYTFQGNDRSCNLFSTTTKPYMPANGSDSGGKVQRVQAASIALEKSNDTSINSVQCKLASVWSNHTSAGDSTWTISANGTAIEQGMGFARGHATISGRTLTITFNTLLNNGKYIMQLDENCTSAKGKVVILGGVNAGWEITSAFASGK